MVLEVMKVSLWFERVLGKVMGNEGFEEEGKNN
jgi:hypothetical protein